MYQTAHQHLFFLLILGLIGFLGCENTPLPLPIEENQNQLEALMGTYSGTYDATKDVYLECVNCTPSGTGLTVSQQTTASFACQIQLSQVTDETFKVQFLPNELEAETQWISDTLTAGYGSDTITWKTTYQLDEILTFTSEDSVYSSYQDNSEIGYWKETRKVTLSWVPEADEITITLADTSVQAAYVNDVFVSHTFKGKKLP